MSAYISPFDARFIKLGNAARLTAEDNPALIAEDVIDLLVRAVFAGAFDPTPIDAGDDPDNPEHNAAENWLQIPICAPVNRLTPAQDKLRPRPTEYFGANRNTVASVMHSISALPGDADQWDGLLHDRSCDTAELEAFTALMRMQFDAYPQAGQEYLKGIYIPKAKLQRWFEFRSIPVPAFLKPPKDAATDFGKYQPPARSKLAANSRKRSQGRPQKTAWSTIIPTILELRKERPTMRKKAVAFEAWRLAAEKLPKDDLPSVATIQRKIGEIIRDYENKKRH